jgi:hypothetical protein
MKVTNRTDHDLGFNGYVVPAGDTVIVPAVDGKRMTSQNPEFFVKADPAEKARPPRKAVVHRGGDQKPEELPLPFEPGKLTVK